VYVCVCVVCVCDVWVCLWCVGVCVRVCVCAWCVGVCLGVFVLNLKYPTCNALAPYCQFDIFHPEVL